MRTGGEEGLERNMRETLGVKSTFATFIVMIVFWVSKLRKSYPISVCSLLCIDFIQCSEQSLRCPCSDPTYWQWQPRVTLSS